MNELRRGCVRGKGVVWFRERRLRVEKNKDGEKILFKVVSWFLLIFRKVE